MKYISLVNTYQTEFGPFTGQLPEIIATEQGLKPVSRFRCYDESDYEHLKEACETYEIQVIRGHVTFDRYRTNAEEFGFYVYIEKAKRLDPSVNDSGDQARFGEILGYPKCCINNSLKFSKSKGRKEKYLKDKIDFRLNTFLKFSNFYLISHFPCSWKCNRTIKYADNLCQALADYDKNYFNLLKKNLRYPALIAFPKKSNFLDSFDHRDGILFNGQSNGNTLHYKNFQRISIVDSDDLLDDTISHLYQGNNLKVDKNQIIIRNGREEIAKLEIEGNLKLFRFY